MPRAAKQPPSSGGRVTRSGRQQNEMGVVSPEEIEVPTQVRHTIKRKRAQTTTTPQKRTRQVAIKRAGRNVPSPQQETDLEYTPQEELEDESGQASAE
jgi:hypothetical protein